MEEWMACSGFSRTRHVKITCDIHEYHVKITCVENKKELFVYTVHSTCLILPDHGPHYANKDNPPSSQKKPSSKNST